MTQPKQKTETNSSNRLADQIKLVAANLESTAVGDLPDRDTLVLGMKAFVVACTSKQEWHKQQEQGFLDEVASVRDLLPADEEEDEVKTRRRGPRGPRGTKKLTDYNVDVLKKLGKKGATKLELAQAVIDAGFEPGGQAAKDLNKFAGSNYTSGIYPLLNNGEIETFRVQGERETRYRLAKAK